MLQTAEEDIIKADVNISTVFKTVIDINEQDHIIELKFSISLKWFESRASFFNLKTNPALNILNEDEIKQIWIPYLIFEVTNKQSLTCIYHTHKLIQF